MTQVHCRFRMARPFQDPPRYGPQGKNMTGTAQILGLGVGINGNLDSAGAVLGRNARGDSLLRRGIDTDGEGGLVGVGVGGYH